MPPGTHPTISAVTKRSRPATESQRVLPRDCQCAADSAITKMGSIALPCVSTPTVELLEEGRLHLITTAQDAESRNTCKGLEPNGIAETRVIDSVLSTGTPLMDQSRPVGPWLYPVVRTSPFGIQQNPVQPGSPLQPGSPPDRISSVRAATRPHTAPLDGQSFVEEHVESSLAAARPGPDKTAGVVINNDDQVAVPAFVRDLIDPDSTQTAKTIDGGFDVIVDAGDDRSNGPPRHP